MGSPFGAMLEAMVIAWALSLDALVASFAYGSKGIKIPLRSTALIAFICAATVGLALIAGMVLKQYIPAGLTLAISFAILFTLGVLKLLDSITKSIIRRHTGINKEIAFSLLNFKFILMLYADPEQADVDGSKVLSPAEAAALATALSLDGIAVGLGAAMGSANGLMVFLCVLAAGLIALLGGAFLGNKAAGRTPFDLSWLSGVLLIVLAFSQLW